MVGPVSSRPSITSPRITDDTEVKQAAAKKTEGQDGAATPSAKKPMAEIPGDKSGTAKQAAEASPAVKGGAGSAPAPKAGDLRPSRAAGAGKPKEMSDKQLGEALTKGDAKAEATALKYMAANPERAADFLKSVTTGSGKLEPEKLGKLLAKMDGASLSAAMDGLGKMSDPQAAQEVMRAVAKQASDPANPGGPELQSKIRDAWSKNIEGSGKELFGRIIADAVGGKKGDEPNYAQSMLADYFGRMDPASMESFMKSAGEDRSMFQGFIQSNVPDADLKRIADPPLGAANADLQKTAGQQLEGIFGNTADPAGRARAQELYLASLGKMDAATMEAHFKDADTKWAGNWQRELVGTLSDPQRQQMADAVAKNGSPYAKAMVGAGIADTLTAKLPDASAAEVQAAQKQLFALMSSDPNRMIRDMDPADLKNTIKTFLAPPPAKDLLEKILPQLSAQSAGMLAAQATSAAREVVDRVQAGTWNQNVRSGIEVEAELGVESLGLGTKYKFSPAGLVGSEIKKETASVLESYNGLMENWTRKYLNNMGPNSKSQFTQALGPEAITK